ncbi:M81 family metallopeptidase [Novosphingobium piscinae]|uniref:Microcystinase C n=1 Tax=Novosphingobium piscinae TaxID=1507448 RepID=A0A7X1FYF8_9SPHN|nr:M81 family metallopeptidase [Novosphingobium piscinae]MBC2669295.1 M81 family metallopeptidase [Novosphingobium piscinae]
MIVFACGIMHESHSFNNRLTPLENFRNATPGCIAADPELINTRSVEGGILSAARDFSWDLRFPFSAHATPSGPLSADAMDTLVARMTEQLREAGPVDGVLLSLHGAMFAVNEPDCEGAILSAVRSVVGPNLPVAIALDPHANFTDRMADLADIATSFRTTPHVDQWETTYRAGCLLNDAMAGRTRPQLYVGRLPMLAGLDMGRTLDPDSPMNRLKRLAREIEQTEAGVLNIDINAGFYYGDVAEAGPSVVVTGHGEDSRFQDIADRLIAEAWKTRDYVSIAFTPLEQAIARARQPATKTGPLILVDYTDGPAGGAHGDGTTLLKLLLDADIDNSVVGPIFDPISVEQAVAAGVGQTIALDIGGRTDPAYGGGPVSLECRVECISDGNYLRKGPYAQGTVGAFGPSVSLRRGNVTIILVSKRLQPEDREQYRIFGIDPEGVNVLACKGINHFRADFEPIARELVFVDTGGLVTVDFKVFPFRNVRRPIWPLDAVELPT